MPLPVWGNGGGGATVRVSRAETPAASGPPKWCTGDTESRSNPPGGQAHAAAPPARDPTGHRPWPPTGWLPQPPIHQTSLLALAAPVLHSSGQHSNRYPSPPIGLRRRRSGVCVVRHPVDGVRAVWRPGSRRLDPQEAQEGQAGAGGGRAGQGQARVSGTRCPLPDPHQRCSARPSSPPSRTPSEWGGGCRGLQQYEPQ